MGNISKSRRMKKITRISLVLFIIACFFSCADENLVITKDTMMGKWLIKDRAFGFTTDCERNEYIIFNADSTLLRQQCGQTTGNWYIQNEKLILNLTLDTTYSNSQYDCELLSEDEIKIKSVDMAYIWATYKKEK